MLNKPSMQHIEVDGQPMLIASMLRKGTAVAIDLGLIVAFASMCLGVISWFIPLDDAKAKLPISTVVFAATFYVVVGRNRWYSAGRRILRLRLVPLPGRAASFFNKAISVHIDPKPPEDNSALAFALCLIGISTGMALLSLAAALATTHIFKTVQEHAAAQPSALLRNGLGPDLSPLPRALLISPYKGYVQVGASWGTETDVLDFYLSRRSSKERWVVTGVKVAESRILGDYSLGAIATDVPEFSN